MSTAPAAPTILDNIIKTAESEESFIIAATSAVAPRYAPVVKMLLDAAFALFHLVTGTTPTTSSPPTAPVA